jgi:hypothetical protein
MGIPAELSKNRLVQASSDKRFGMLWYFHKPTAASCALALSPQALVFAIAFAIALVFIWLPQADCSFLRAALSPQPICTAHQLFILNDALVGQGDENNGNQREHQTQARRWLGLLKQRHEQCYKKQK